MLVRNLAETYKLRGKKEPMRKKFEELEKEREENIIVLGIVMFEVVLAIGYMTM